VTLVGYLNYPSRIAVDASALYARNLLSFLGLLVDKKEGKLKIDREDEIIKGSLLTIDGAVVHPALVEGA
jgi:NAD(P) transhydrogenase subunit alpha